DAEPSRQRTNDLEWINKYDQSPRAKLRKKHNEKLQKLIDKHDLKLKRSAKIITTNDTSNVVNMSKTVLTHEQMYVLSKGLKYVPTPSSLNVIDIITNSEKSLFNVPKIFKQAAFAEISTYVSKWKKPEHNNLSKEERLALKQIKCNPAITVVTADKGGKVVVMDRDTYVLQIEEHLNNRNIYENVKDPTNLIKKIFVDELNLRKETIKFTYEFEKDKKLNYLDTTLSRNTVDKAIDLKWFRKDTASDRLLHFESAHHTSIKFNIIKNMATRIINTTRNNNQQLEDLYTLKQILIKSKYPLNLIDNSFQKCLLQNNNNTTTQPTKKKNEDMQFSLCLPYARGMEVLKRKLEKLKIKL
ncbi:unnamed protein product, partial [Rotaria sordida]